MTQQDIKTATHSELLTWQAMAMNAQGNGANFSQMLENRIDKIKKELDRRAFNDFLDKQDEYFSEGHLQGWFQNIYKGKLKREIAFQLETQHDFSCEIENCESELKREITDKEIAILEKRFYKAVYKAIKFSRNGAEYWIDSVGNKNF